MPEEIAEFYLTHAEIGLRLQQPAREIIERIKRGEFGKGAIAQGRDYLVPLSDFNAYVRACRLFDEAGELKPIHARPGAQASRKVGLLRGRVSPPS